MGTLNSSVNLLHNRLLYAVQFEHRNACLHFDAIFHTNHPSFSLEFNLKIYLTDPYKGQILVGVHNGMLLIYTKQFARLLLRRRVFLELGESE